MGTVTFTFRNRWKLPPDAWDNICEDLFSFIQDITPVDTGYCQESWEVQGQDSTECTFFNSADYASYLDDGWSSQAPSGMTGPARDELLNLVERYS